MTEIAQEKCDHTSDFEDSDLDPDLVDHSDEEKKNETGKWDQKPTSGIFSKGARKGGLSTLFR